MISNSLTIIKTLLVLFLVFAGLHYAKDFLMPLFIAGVLATLLLPFCLAMEKKKLPKGLAVLLCVISLLIAFAAIVSILGWQISALSEDFAVIKQKFIKAIDRIQEYFFKHSGISAAKQSEILMDEQPSVTNLVQVVGGSLAYVFMNFIFIIVYIFGLLFYRNHIKRFILKLTPFAKWKESELVLYRVTQVSQQYLVGLAKMIVCLWIMYSIGFSIVGINNPLFFAFLCGILEIVPFIGNITGTLVTLLVATAKGASLPMLAGIAGIYGFVQLVQGWILEPLIVGPQVRINPFSTIIAVIIGEMVWGIPGIFLAIPLMAMFKIICDHIEPLKPYGFLIGEVEVGKKESGFQKKLLSFFKKKSQKK